MKTKFSLVILAALLSSSNVRAEGFWDATKNYAQKYGLPCAAGLAAGYVIDRDKGLQFGAVGCTIVFTYGEFGRGANRTITDDDVEIIKDMIQKSNGSMAGKLQSDFDQKFDRMHERILDAETRNRQQIRNTVTDLGVFLDKDLTEKIDKKIENPRLMKEIETKITERVKEEVQEEFRSKEREIVEKTVNKTIKRVTAEPVVIEDGPSQREKSPQD